MDDDRPLFILAGNGPYENRGCEAIIRGTVEIIKTRFNKPQFLCASVFNGQEQYLQQRDTETDPDVSHIAINTYKKPDKRVYIAYAASRLSDRLHGEILFRNLKRFLPRAEGVLSVGGDNYTLSGTDLPKNCISLDNFVLRNNVPIYIWGASIGPFSARPKYEQYMADHLNKVTLIFARETATVRYLNQIGVRDNIVQVADPAFVMRPVKPSHHWDSNIPSESIGLNFSPLMALFFTEGDISRWRNIVIKMITDISDNLDNRIFLIPHVIIPGIFDNDHDFLKSVMTGIPQGIDVELISPEYNAAELKWIISSLKLFVGARTHSTIAALSSCVPTISISYSEKSKGINQDVFGHQQYCMRPEPANIDSITDGIVNAYHDAKNIKKNLSEKIPYFLGLADRSGDILARQMR